MLEAGSFTTESTEDTERKKKATFAFFSVISVLNVVKIDSGACACGDGEAAGAGCVLLAETAPPGHGERSDCDKTQLQHDKRDQPEDGAIHEAITVQTDTQHV